MRGDWGEFALLAPGALPPLRSFFAASSKLLRTRNIYEQMKSVEGWVAPSP
jgi:hypothetical protein